MWGVFMVYAYNFYNISHNLFLFLKASGHGVYAGIPPGDLDPATAVKLERLNSASKLSCMNI